MKKLFFVLSIAFALVIFGDILLQAQSTTVKQKTRKGWSHKKKETVIGAGAGAAAGAIISKDKSKGAIIGGVVGAGAGYLHGKHKDKKDPVTKKVTKTKKTVQ